MRDCLKILTKPFTSGIILFLSIVFLLSFPDAFFYIKAYRAITYSTYIILQNIIISYVICIILYFIPHRKSFSTLKYLILLICLFLFIFDFICIFQHESRFNADFLTMVLSTNKEEAKEFFLSFATVNNILYDIGLALFSCFILWVNKQNVNLPNVFGYVGCFIVLLSGILCYRNSSVWKDGVIGKIKAVYSYDLPDLHEYLSHPKLVYDRNERPANVVLIIGESLSKYHCSLYGYEKPTNPILETMRDSSLSVFTKVTSAAIHTASSFKYMMSTYSIEDDGKSNWYEHTTLPEIMDIAGYKTHWLSNQAQGGNSIINRFVDLFDEYEYNGDIFAGDERKTFDGDLVEMAKPIIKNTKDSLNFYVFHLMGSHFKFDLRYPSEFSQFKIDDYMDKPENQRERLAAYDNSVLYNDYVVSQIMKLFNDKNSVVIYLSDHGLDVFYTDDDYAAHAKMNNPESIKYGVAIPFMIYTSPSFDEKYPMRSSRIRNSIDNEFVSDDLIYSIMDVIGIDSINNYSIKDRSILSEVE